MGLPGRRWLAGRAPNQFVTASFVPRRFGKKEGIFDLAALVPAIHTANKILGKMAGQGALLGFGKIFESGPHAKVCPVSGLNRTKMFHVKHFGTIDGREEHTFAKRDNCRLDEIFCPFGKAWATES